MTNFLNLRLKEKIEKQKKTIKRQRNIIIVLSIALICAFGVIWYYKTITYTKGELALQDKNERIKADLYECMASKNNKLN